MKHFSTIAAILLLVPGLCLGKVEMPEWSDPKEAAAYSLGGGLWPEGLIPKETETADAKKDGKKDKKVAENGEKEPATEGEEGAKKVKTGPTVVGDRAVEDESEVVARTNENGEEIAEQQVEEEEEVLPPIEGELRDWYFRMAPVDFLLDPQSLLTEQKSNDVRRFLEFHSDESNFHIYVMVLGETQEIPEDIDIYKLHKEWFGENPAVLMVYYREVPERTRLIYNNSVRTAFEPVVFDRILQNCLREGAATEHAPDQVEKMAVELSIQLYWLARLLERQLQSHQTQSQGSGAIEAVAEQGAVVPQVLREDAPNLFPEVSEASRWVRYAAQWAALLGIVFGIGFMVWLMLLWFRREGAGGKPLLFPECTIAPRLGGEFSGGGFVSMSFDIGDGSTESTGSYS